MGGYNWFLLPYFYFLCCFAWNIALSAGFFWCFIPYLFIIIFYLVLLPYVFCFLDVFCAHFCFLLILLLFCSIILRCLPIRRLSGCFFVFYMLCFTWNNFFWFALCNVLPCLGLLATCLFYMLEVLVLFHVKHLCLSAFFH